MGVIASGRKLSERQKVPCRVAVTENCKEKRIHIVKSIIKHADPATFVVKEEDIHNLAWVSIDGHQFPDFGSVLVP